MKTKVRTKIIRKCLFILALILWSQLSISQIIIDEGEESATERTNARTIVEDNDGILHVVYYHNGIFYSYSDDGGVNWSTPLQITDVGRNPSIAVDTSNILHLVFKNGHTDAYSIAYWTYDGTWSSESTISGGGATVKRPAIAIDSENNLHCVWQRGGFGATANSEIWYSKYITGTGWNSAINLSNSEGASEYPTLTIDSENNVYAIWKDSEETTFYPKRVLFKKYTIGSGWDTDYTIVCETITDDNWATMDPCAVVDSEDNIHLVWSDKSSGNREVYYKKCTDGVWDTSSVNISNTPSNRAKMPIISIDEFDNLYVAWEKKYGAYYDIVYKIYENSSGTWSEEINISNTAGSFSDSRYPNSTITTKEHFHIIWTESEIPYYVMYYNADVITSVNNSFVSQNIKLYPNPSDGHFNLIINENINEDLLINIFNVQSQLIYEEKINNVTKGYLKQIDIYDYAKGMYYLRLTTNNMIYTKKIIND